MQYIYLIACQKYFKIGITNNVPARLAQLYVGNPFEMDVVVIYGFENAECVERSIHQRFRRNKIRGEWFELTEAEVGVFNEICQLLDGKETYYEESICENEDEEESLKTNTWRMSKKNMDDLEILEISNSSIESIVAKYSVSERTASNWRAYARREADGFTVRQD